MVGGITMEALYSGTTHQTHTIIKHLPDFLPDAEAMLTVLLIHQTTLTVMNIRHASRNRLRDFLPDAEARDGRSDNHGEAQT